MSRLDSHGCQVTLRPGNEPVGELWAEGRVFAVGDCNYGSLAVADSITYMVHVGRPGCIGNPPDWIMPPVPKISFPSEEQAAHACANLRALASDTPKEPVACMAL